MPKYLKIVGATIFTVVFIFILFPNLASKTVEVFDFDKCNISDYSTAHEYQQAALDVEAYEGDAECAIELWKKVVEMRPTDVTASANLAMRLTQSDRHREALEYYKETLKLGGGDSEVFAWYARSLRELGQIPLAVDWYYRTLSVNSRLSDITGELSELLAMQNQRYEAINVLASFEELTGYSNYFKGRKVSLQAALDEQGRNYEKQSFRVPKLHNDHFYIFARLSENIEHRGKAFMVDTGATMLTLDQTWLDEQKTDYKVVKSRIRAQVADGRTIKAKLIKLPSFQLGPFELHNVKAFLCKNCASLIGQNILENFDLQTKRINGVEFLHLKERP